ncbi:MAG: hypothetical protein HQK86_01685 [Nitrospinae bacterium]|nr:hypothetical protein [Nitrospinota bacterium]MBF0633681.1 hypothetical protein [Nitrospinota bacterium]
MRCVIKYRPIIRNTSSDHRSALKSAFIRGDELCPPCQADGRKSTIEERYGEST